MVQTFFERSCTIDRLRRGPLAGHIDLFAARFATDGYSRVHSRIQLRRLGTDDWGQTKSTPMFGSPLPFTTGLLFVPETHVPENQLMLIIACRGV